MRWATQALHRLRIRILAAEQERTRQGGDVAHRPDCRARAAHRALARRKKVVDISLDSPDVQESFRQSSRKRVVAGAGEARTAGRRRSRSSIMTGGAVPKFDDPAATRSVGSRRG